MSLFALPAEDLNDILRLAEKDLVQLRGKSLFLTGGTGFFGKWLLGALCHANTTLNLELNLTVLSRDPASFLKRYPDLGTISSLRFVAGHVADLFMKDARFDYVIHAATDTTAFTTAAEEQDRARAIVNGTRRVLDVAHKSGVQRLLNISSGAVYGAYAGKRSGAREEDYPLAVPMTPYAEAKRLAEQLCEASEVDCVTARAFAFLGPYLPLDAHFAAGNFLRDARRGGPVIVRGDGTALRSYLYPADLIVWLFRILLRGKRANAYNVGSDEFVSTAQLAYRIADAVKPKPEIVIQATEAQGPQNIYLPDISRAQTELNLDVSIPLHDAIHRTVLF